MLHSKVGKNGQTTIPHKIRKELHIEAGDRLEFTVTGDHVTIQVCRGLLALEGALVSDRGKGLSFAEIREAAAVAARDSAMS